MKRYFFSISLFFITAVGFTQLNITQLSNLEYSRNLSDVWGWDNGGGTEYALVGVNNGFSVVDISDAVNPVEIFFEEGNNSIWRDIKTWNNYAYVTTEGGGGLLILDLASLPLDTIKTYYNGSSYPFQSAHNLYIDENGIAYIFGADYAEGGAIMLDLNTDPMAPVEIGLFDDYYTHDGVVRGDTLWASCINDGIQATVDISDKANPVLLATWATPNDFAHNCWFSDDGKYLFTTDEKEYAYIASYDVSDLNNVVELDRWQSNAGTGTIPHNTHYMNGYLITSYYNDGIIINDVSDPSRIIEVGNFDTSPDFAGNDAGGFHGSWGAYPWLPSGVILSADIENGLFVLEPTYKRASYLEGLVYEEGTSNLIEGANIEIIGYGVVDITNGLGEYSTGIPESNSVDVVFSAPGFYSDTVTLMLTQSTIISYDALLASKPKLDANGIVLNGAWLNVPGAMIDISNNSYEYKTASDTSGLFLIDDLFFDTYNITAGSWGYKTTQENISIDSNTGTIIAFVEDGYYDDFTFDFGWTVSGNATAGIWERAVPNGTDYNGSISNPDLDLSDDISNMAYVTGNNGTSGGDDDIDDGTTLLTSPILKLSTYADPYAKFSTWFFNGGGFGGVPNDSLKIYISNGVDTAMIVYQDISSNMSDWVAHNVKLSDFITINNNMYFIVEAVDLPDGHIVEAGFDGFRITDGISSVSPADQLEVQSLKLFPNPFNDYLTVEFDDFSGALLDIIDITGKTIYSERMNSSKQKVNLNTKSGIYFLSVTKDGEILDKDKIVKF